MKPTLLVSALVLLSAVPLSAATPMGVLLKAEVVRTAPHQVTASGAATAILKGVGEQLRVDADHITFNSEKNSLVFVGSVRITINGRLLATQEASIDLGEQPARVFSLDKSGNLETENGINFIQNLNPIQTKLLPANP
jgi:lipopolysaccharide assembly outer membrane protein LptD (OstA)